MNLWVIEYYSQQFGAKEELFMKIVDAFWEQRNLGVVAKEINFEANDKVSDLDQIRNLDCEYSVARIPAGCIDLMFNLEEMGYRFIETMLDVQHDHKDIGFTLNRVAKRIADSITYYEMNDIDLNELRNQLRLGIFKTDRVSLDPAFSPDKSANRYIGWIGDELTRDGKVYKCIHKDNVFGYFVCRMDGDKVNYVYNIGIYKDQNYAGLGVGLIIASIKQALEAGAKKTISGLSTNNMPAIAANLAAGYRVIGAKYIYVKHNAPRK